MKKTRQRKAFTIVEMSIVIAVIAILAAVAIPVVGGIIKSANKSADEQFAGSLSVQLALWEVDNNREIKNEDDLYEAVKSHYGDETDKVLTPKSGKYGYHYWYDVDKKSMVLKEFDELDSSTSPTGYAADDVVFELAANGNGSNPQSDLSIASPRYITKGDRNYFFMDKGGSEIADIINGFENITNENVYGELIEDLKDLAEENEVAELVWNKIQKTMIITGSMAFCCVEPQTVEQTWIPYGTSELKQVELFYYDGEVVEGTGSGIESAENVTDIYLPSGTTVGIGGMPAINEHQYDNDHVGERDYSDTTKLHVNVEKIEDLENIYTNCVIVMPNGAQYMYFGNKYYSLPISFDDAGEPIDTPIGSVKEGLLSIEDFDIECGEAKDSNAGEDKVYLYNNVLYVAYDKEGVDLSLTNGVYNNMVNWTSDNEAIVTVDNGTVKINSLPDVGLSANYTADITAVYKYGDTKAATITVYVVRPTSVDFTIGTVPVTLNSDTDKGSINIQYTGDNQVLDISEDLEVYMNQDGMVAVEKGNLTFAYAENNGLFTIETDAETGKKTLVINTDNLNGTGSQDITITYTADGTEYFSRSYTVNIEDLSSAPFEPDFITDTTKIDEDYLFRVGNQGAISLSTLFDNIKIKGDIVLTVYNATSANQEGEMPPIATSGDGFWANYTSVLSFNENDANYWANSTITFSGTGVAVVQIEGSTPIAVEVVNGKNVTAIGAFTGSTSGNYVLLKDISAGTSRVGTISGTIYGNGFTIDASNYTNANAYDFINLNGGVIDNVVIQGPIYPKVVYYSNGGKETGYFVRGISIAGSAQISNSYISGFRSPVIMSGDKLVMINTTLVGGVYSNMDVTNGDVELTNVTTVQRPTQSSFDDKPTVLGAGIVFSTEAAAKESDITLNGTLEQYNWVTESDAAYLPSDYQSAFKALFKETDYVHEGKYMNTGIVFGGIREIGINDFRTDKSAKPFGAPIEKTVLGVSGTIFTYLGEGQTVTLEPSAYVPTMQADYLPTFIYTGMGTVEDAAKDCHYYDTAENVIRVSLTVGQSYTFNPVAGVVVEKYSGKTLTANVDKVGEGATLNNDGTVTVSAAGTYTITYSVADTILYDKNGEPVVEYSALRTETIDIVVGLKAVPDAIITFRTLSASDIYVLWTTADTKGDWGWAIPLDAVIITDGNTTISGSSFNSTNSLPEGFALAITGNSTGAGSSNGGPGWELASYNNKLWIRSTGTINNPTAKDFTFTFEYTGLSGNTVKNSISVSFPKGKGSYYLFGNNFSCESGGTAAGYKDFTSVATDKITVTYK